MTLQELKRLLSSAGQIDPECASFSIKFQKCSGIDAILMKNYVAVLAFPRVLKQSKAGFLRAYLRLTVLTG